MAKFDSLNDSDKIQVVKDEFLNIIDHLSSEPSKINEVLGVNEAPKPVVAITTPLTDKMSRDERATVEARNAEAETKAKAENERITAEFATKVEAAKKIGEILKNMTKKEGCICGSCFNTEITSGILAPELEPLIDVAKKNAAASNA